MNAVRRPGPDSTLDDVRLRLIEVATELLLSVGVELGIGHVKLSEVIDRAGVTRATAYRSLADDMRSPQDKLRFEVLSSLLSRDSRRENRDLITGAAMALLAERADDLGSPDIAVRTDVLRSLIRVSSGASHFGIAGSVERGVLVACYGALISQGDDRPQWQVDMLRKGEDDLLEMFAEVYRDLSAAFQMHLRPELTMEAFATAVAALAEGLGVRSIVNRHVDGIPDPASGSTEEPWTLQAIAVLTLVKWAFVPDDPDNPFVDPALL